MHGLVKCMLVVLAAGGLAVLGLFIALFTDGGSIADGERAVMALAGFDLLLWVAASLALVPASAGLAGWPRWLAVSGGSLALLLFLVAWMFMTLVMFNR
jgi:uncharacterized membrane protein YhdT